MDKIRKKPLTITVMVVIVLLVIVSSFEIIEIYNEPVQSAQNAAEITSKGINGTFWLVIFLSVIQVIFLLVKRGKFRIFSLISSIINFVISLISVPIFIFVMKKMESVIVYTLLPQASLGGKYTATPFGYALVILSVINVILQTMWCIVTRKKVVKNIDNGKI